MKLDFIRKEYSAIQVAYLAGIIDGEGSIYIGCYSHNPKTGTPHYQTKIEVSNTSEPLVDWLIANFEGNKTMYTAKQLAKNSRRAVYRWTIWSDRVAHLCEIMLPYLVIKKREAEIMIEMRETYKKTHMQKGQQGTQPIEKSVLADRERLYKEIKSLHIR
jgi:hypothetical protein